MLKDYATGYVTYVKESEPDVTDRAKVNVKTKGIHTLLPAPSDVVAAYLTMNGTRYRIDTKDKNGFWIDVNDHYEDLDDELYDELTKHRSSFTDGYFKTKEEYDNLLLEEKIMLEMSVLDGAMRSITLSIDDDGDEEKRIYLIDKDQLHEGGYANLFEDYTLYPLTVMKVMSRKEDPDRYDTLVKDGPFTEYEKYGANTGAEFTTDDDKLFVFFNDICEEAIGEEDF